MKRKSEKFEVDERTASDGSFEQTTSIKATEASDRPNRSNEKARATQRSSSELRTIVQIRDRAGSIWKEVTKVDTVSRNGAGFVLSRECTVGRLVVMLMPMPVELRAYDLAEDLYPVLGIVQHCNKTAINDETVFHVGVAFIGKRMPPSFTQDAYQSYRITGMSEDGLWEVTEAGNQFMARRHPRYSCAVEVVISLMQKRNRAVNKENAVTLNIGASGAAVPCSLPAKVGDKVKFACELHNFYAIALVRHRTVNDHETPVLHLEFVEHQFPIIHLNVFDHPEPNPDVEQQTAAFQESSASFQFI